MADETKKKAAPAKEAKPEAAAEKPAKAADETKAKKAAAPAADAPKADAAAPVAAAAPTAAELLGEDPNAKKIGGLLSYQEKLYVSAYAYYDGGGTQVLSHFVSGLDLGTLSEIGGPYRVGKLKAGGVGANEDVKLFQARERLRLGQDLRILTALQFKRLV